MNEIDLKLQQLPDSTFDLIEGDYGDFEATEGFDTSLFISVLTDARATEVEITQAKDRGGWLGDLVPVIEGYATGSLLWTFNQRRRTTESLNGAIDAVEKSLTWLLDLAYAKDLSVTGSLMQDGANIQIVVTSFSGETDTINVPIWKATVNGY